MKPLKLTMSAFGSYADTQCIDFTRLGASGLYLITGETGSGKTTIFDAISFALFGKASGAGRDDCAMLRSDFSEEKAKTAVELDFTASGKCYNIKRSIKKTGQEPVLTLPDGSVLGGERNVRPKIAEIIGLDREQFAQIVMIAQNDFLRFLQSGTEERVKILRRIFGTEALRQFQEQLKERERRVKGEREMVLHDFARYEVDVYQREATFAAWEAQSRVDRAALQETDTELADCDRRRQELAAALAVAEGDSKKFTDLDRLRLDFAAHRALSGEIAGTKTRIARGEAALRRIKPLADGLRRAAEEHETALTALADAKKRETAAEAELQGAVRAVEALPPLEKAQGDFAALSKAWEGSAERQKRLSALQTDRAAIAGKQAALTKEQGEFEALQAMFSASDARYRDMEEIFLRSQ
ncbi:MAG: SMC family ATPase, partial [Firmicutes bacterium]|nr:SMC family ATPase [Bacillota bacterium]